MSGFKFTVTIVGKQWEISRKKSLKDTLQN